MFRRRGVLPGTCGGDGAQPGKLVGGGKFSLLCHNLTRPKLEGAAILLHFSMLSPRLPNYFRTYRRRAGLSQAEVAFLLGNQSGAHVCHYECFRRVPSLKTALAFAVIFQTPIEALCAGERQKVEREVHRQARRLWARLATENPDQPTTRKLVLLESLFGKLANANVL